MSGGFDQLSGSSYADTVSERTNPPRTDSLGQSGSDVDGIARRIFVVEQLQALFVRARKVLRGRPTSLDDAYRG
jgi:hypothetical protein